VYHLEGSISALVIELGHPVVRRVEHLVAGGGIRNILGIKGAHLPAERISSNDTVHMAATHSWVEDRVAPLNGEGSTVHCKRITI